tara:strand:+ start:66 stop:566 length:501 start_codon:yes stop_codon:yes gene_type:complete
MNRKRAIKSKDWTGHEFNYGLVLSEHSVGYWNVECSMCGETHTYETRNIRNSGRSKQCNMYRSPNWSGLEREDNNMRRKYGISEQEYHGLVEYQNGKCAICFTELSEMSRRPNIDHDHSTNEVRGILCTGCNTGLGHLGDNIEGLERALYYLKNTPYAEFKYSNAR